MEEARVLKKQAVKKFPSLANRLPDFYHFIPYEHNYCLIALKIFWKVRISQETER